MAKITTYREAPTSWKDIKAALNSGRSIKVGTVVTDKLKNGKTVQFVCVASNHYGEGEAIFFCKTVAFNFHMHRYGESIDNYRDCDMRSYLDRGVVEDLPDELVEVISPRTLKEVNESGETVEFTDRVWLLSVKEVFDDWFRSAPNSEDKQFPYFKKRLNRILVDDNDDLKYWWLRSPYASSSSTFCYVFSYGGAISGNATTSYGVAFGFCIKSDIT